ncbi:MAG: glycosyltransferase family 4 protein [Bacteroidetes bacterium]|nr:glycosyltransferase family 4 protein [Bacteroidota bacterium]
MKILFVLEHYHPYIGGAERLFKDLAESLVSEGAEVQVITTRFDKRLPAKAVLNGVKVKRITCRNRFLFTFMSLPAIWRLAGNCDFIHTTTYNAALPAWLGARLRRKPITITFHEVWGKLWLRLPFASAFSRRLFYLYEQLILKLGFDRYVAVSNSTRDALVEHGVAADKVIRIYNGLDYESFKGYDYAPSGEFCFAYFGRLGISKGLDLLLPAASRYFEEGGEGRMILIIPKTPQNVYKKVMELLEQYALHDRTDVWHELDRDSLFKKICQCTAVVIPSYSEGFCFVAAEAVAMGIPVVSSHQAALREVVTGKLIRSEGQSIEAYFNALNRAAAGDWDEIPVIRYRMRDSVAEYLKLYKGLSKDAK